MQYGQPALIPRLPVDLDLHVEWIEACASREIDATIALHYPQSQELPGQGSILHGFDFVPSLSRIWSQCAP